MTRFSLNPDNHVLAGNSSWGHPKKSASGEDTEPHEEADETEAHGADEEGDAPPTPARQRQLEAMQAQLQELQQSQRQADMEKVGQFNRLKREAVASGDTERYDDLVKEEGRFYAGLNARQQQQQPSQGDAAITEAWMRKNRWMQNHFLAGQAQAIAQRYADKGVTGAEQLRRVEREMREQFGDMIANYETSKTGQNRSSSGGRRDWNSIPARDRKMLEDQFIKAGVSNRLPDTPQTRARLAKSYWESNG
jgi:hypothetical protein